MRKRAKSAAIVAANVYTIIGYGSAASAMTGAKMVENRAKRLQMPNAVAQISVGKNKGVARYAILNAKEIPNLASKTKVAVKPPSESSSS